MAVPRNRSSVARRNSRRSHMAKSPSNASSCSNCSKMKLSHRVCPHCGHYNNKAIISNDSE